MYVDDDDVELTKWNNGHVTVRLKNKESNFKVADWEMFFHSIVKWNIYLEEEEEGKDKYGI